MGVTEIKRSVKSGFVKWSGWIVALAIVAGIAVYAVSIRQQLWFSVTSPKAVTACMEGYTGEHPDADKRFEMKQTSKIISPLQEEVKNE